jgi:histidyl-tRNA synthetase
MKISAPKGTRDILPAEVARWRHAEQVFAHVCALHGYEEIRIPTFEATELFNAGLAIRPTSCRKRCTRSRTRAGAA